MLHLICSHCHASDHSVSDCPDIYISCHESKHVDMASLKPNNHLDQSYDLEWCDQSISKESPRGPDPYRDLPKDFRISILPLPQDELYN